MTSNWQTLNLISDHKTISNDSFRVLDARTIPTERRATVGLLQNPFDKDYHMQEQQKERRTTVRLLQNPFDKDYPMQERQEERWATVRLRHNPFAKDYTMQEEMKEEGRNNGTIGKPQDGQKDQGPRKNL